jgi:hypothetical protein
MALAWGMAAPTIASPASENFTLTGHAFGGGGGAASSQNAEGFFVLGEWAVGEAASDNATMVAGLLAGASGDGAPGSDLVVEVSDFPAEVQRETALGWTATIRNVGSETAGFDSARVDVSGPVTTSLPLYSGAVVQLPPGGSLTRPVSLQVPGSAPLGTYSVATVISLAAEDLASDSFETNVIP